MIAFKIIGFLILVNLDNSDCINVCNDWIQYKDIKCIKVVEKKATEPEALNFCTKLDQNSVLLTIHSKDEQEYFNTLLGNYNNISLNVWLGMKYREKAFKWMDVTNTEFSNWSDDAVKNGNDPCVDMSLQKETFGKWDAVPCEKSALIVCQKKQVFNLINLKNVLDIFEDKISKLNIIINSQNNKIENLTKVIENQGNELKELRVDPIKDVIPIGFLYTQLPNQTAPQELWPNTRWTEITSQYSGLFFRAEGRESLPFGQIQQANQSYISDVHYHGCYYDSWLVKHRHCDSKLDISLKQENWDVMSPKISAVNFLNFYTTSGEVRPKNTAIRIFKRIQ